MVISLPVSGFDLCIPAGIRGSGTRVLPIEKVGQERAAALADATAAAASVQAPAPAPAPAPSPATAPLAASAPEGTPPQGGGTLDESIRILRKALGEDGSDSD